MKEYYEFEGQKFEIDPSRLEEFLAKFPNAKKVDRPGKTNDSAIADPMVESNAMGSNLEDGFLEQQESEIAKRDKEERSALDVLKSYHASFYLRATEMVNNFTNAYETGEAPTALGRVAMEIAMENPFVAGYGYAANSHRGHCHDISKEFRGMELKK